MIEKNCKITMNGREYESGGAYILPCKDGKFRGVVYVGPVKDSTWAGCKWAEVSTWHGEFIANARITFYRGNFCNMARVSFHYAGRNFVGDYCPDWAEACKVRSTK